jgi:hypothetical protein
MEQQMQPKKNSCTACHFLKFGVKTRKSIPHTCGKSIDELLKDMETYTKNNKGPGGT